MKKAYLIPAIALSIFTSSCSDSEMTNDTVETTNEETEEVTNDSEEKEKIILKKDGLTLTYTNEHAEFNDAILEMNMPGDADKLPVGENEFVFNVKNYELGNQTPDAETKMCANSSKGQHIHLILNNEPYSAHYESQFNKELEEGNYISMAFLSRSYHMSIKQPDAYVVRKFTVGEPEADSVEFDETAAHMFYSRPKGEYVGEDTKKVMLDFYLINTDLSEEGNKVKATINSTEFILPKWAPYFIEGLPMGENKIILELIDKDGNTIEGPFNSVERTITLSDLN